MTEHLARGRACELHTASPLQGGEATGSFGMPPQPLVRRTDLETFESRPPLTDFEPAKQVRAATHPRGPDSPMAAAPLRCMLWACIPCISMRARSQRGHSGAFRSTGRLLH